VEGAYERGKSHCIIVVAEGSSLNVHQISEYLMDHEVGFETRATILGHVPRGGSPSAFDRLLATRMGVKAVEVLLEGQTDVMIGLAGRDIITVPLEEVVNKSRRPNVELLEMAKILAK
jgi:6-phosphofructokinase 1